MSRSISIHAFSLLVCSLVASGCRSGTIAPGAINAVIPPPALGGDPYYQAPIGTTLPPATGTLASPGSVNLAPTSPGVSATSSLNPNARIGVLNQGASIPATSAVGASSANRNANFNTFNVSERVAADQRPIAISDQPTNTNVAASQPAAWNGMPLNDGTRSRFTGATPNPTFGNFSPYDPLRGTASLPNRMGGATISNDGQWRTRVPNGETERR